MAEVTLNPAVFSKISKDVKLPAYDRSKVRSGIFHFGVGGFHRAHQALVMDNLFSQGLAENWGICGIGILNQDKMMRDVMQKQQCLYTLVEKETSGKLNYRIIGSMVEYLFAPDDVNVVIERLTQPEARIVSLTITEGGYNVNPATGEFDLDVVKDDIKNLGQPKSVFGIVVEALRRRKERGLKGFTIMSCDNLQENGHVARKSFLAFATAVDASLAKWMDENVTFPNSMVDRITPVTTSADRKTISEKLGVTDLWPVVCEPFLQWVLEDKFVAGRPPFEKGSVQLVPDVEPYELMKLRLLNAGHQAIAYVGLLLDYEFVHDAMQDSLIVKYLQAYMDREATHTLKPLPGIDVSDYKAQLVERFQNSYVRDTLARLAVDGSDRILKFVLPVIQHRLAKKEPIWMGVAIVATFAFYANGKTDSGKSIEIVDRNSDKLKALTDKLRVDEKGIKSQHTLFGDSVDNAAFVDTFNEIYKKLQTVGTSKTIEWLIQKN
ncbi:mannitol dehydrogenase DSF1-like [Bradysia coprophila]|uniref:mannitol dehydrogenase DSF1-like n=1 Tax=Bradysia coprophila TaxID=38358 RepID=UPI00187D78A4|nr:mannitol dehydrogenase DSF1-like [Bradysia coprophila]XP_037024428.1 mannitol dehydrogenase DSF1-like [Bradysia coprophila]